jgi:hypothetical protein
MDAVQSFRSIREREQKVLGNYSFAEAIVPDRKNVVTARQADNESPQKKRRGQVLQAQR